MFNSPPTQDKWMKFLNKKQSCIIEICVGTETKISLQLRIEEDNSITISNFQGEGSIADIDYDDIYDTDYYKVKIALDD